MARQDFVFDDHVASTSGTVVVVVIATWEEWKFPILSYSKGRSACQRSYADPPFEAPLSGSIDTLPSTLPTLPSS